MKKLIIKIYDYLKSEYNNKEIAAAECSAFILKHLGTCKNYEQVNSFKVSIENLLINRFPEEIYDPWLKILEGCFNRKLTQLSKI